MLTGGLNTLMSKRKFFTQKKSSKIDENVIEYRPHLACHLRRSGFLAVSSTTSLWMSNPSSIFSTIVFLKCVFKRLEALTFHVRRMAKICISFLTLFRNSLFFWWRIRRRKLPMLCHSSYWPIAASLLQIMSDVYQQANSFQLYVSLLLFSQNQSKIS